jgi:hypothetical protein
VCSQITHEFEQGKWGLPCWHTRAKVSLVVFLNQRTRAVYRHGSPSQTGSCRTLIPCIKLPFADRVCRLLSIQVYPFLASQLARFLVYILSIPARVRLYYNERRSVNVSVSCRCTTQRILKLCVLTWESWFSRLYSPFVFANDVCCKLKSQGAPNNFITGIDLNGDISWIGNCKHISTSIPPSIVTPKFTCNTN